MVINLVLFVSARERFNLLCTIQTENASRREGILINVPELLSVWKKFMSQGVLANRSAVSKPKVKHFFFLTHYLLININSNQSIKFSGSRMKNAMKCSIVLKRTTTETLIMGSLPKSSNTAKKMTEFYTGELIELLTYS